MLRRPWLLLGTLAVLAGIAGSDLGAEPWPFRPGEVSPRGLLAPLVRAAHEHWDLGLMRSIATLATLVLTVVAARMLAVRGASRAAMVLLASGVVAAILLPPVALQAGLRQSTAPWFYTNDSTYQIELAGDLIRHGTDPYGHDFSTSGLERFYSLDGSVRPGTRVRQVALHHFPYFPGTALLATAWRGLPRPFDDFRFLVALCTLGLLAAGLVAPGRLEIRLSVGAALAANPLLARASWFGTADAPSLLCLVLAFALLARRRTGWAALCLGIAVLLKQFALVAVPFFAVMLVAQGHPRRSWKLSAGAFFAPLLAGIVPFLIADPGAFWRDTIAYGGRTYRIVGYGLSSLLLRAGILEDRRGYYPFLWLVLVIWAPVTGWLLWRQWKSRAAWTGAVGFAISIFLLLFISRVFQTSYLAWPLTGLLTAVLLANAHDEWTRAGPEVPSKVTRGKFEAKRAGP